MWVSKDRCWLSKWILCHQPAQFSRLCQKQEKVSCPRCKDNIDNNATEREIKVLVMARKNFLFVNSVEGADALDIYFSLIQTARAHNIELGVYLAAIFKAIPRCKSFDDYEDLRPWNFAKKNQISDQANLVA